MAFSLNVYVSSVAEAACPGPNVAPTSMQDSARRATRLREAEY